MTNDASDQFLDQANEQMGAVERLIKGLPGVQGYVEKETRRDADKRLRLYIAKSLSDMQRRLLRGQQDLLDNSGLKDIDRMDSVLRRLQTLIDRIKTASYGYAGFFDTVRVKEQQLKALHRFDVAMAQQAAGLETTADALIQAIRNNEGVREKITELSDEIDDLDALFAKRGEAVVSPDLLLDDEQLPDVDPTLLTTDQEG